MLFEFPGFLDCSSGLIVAGSEDRVTGVDATALVQKLGIVGHVQGKWHGWGLSFLQAADGGGISGFNPQLDADLGGFFYGYVNCGSFQPKGATLLGGRAGNFYLDKADCTLRNASLQEESGIPFLVIGDFSPVILRNGAVFRVASGSASPSSVSLAIEVPSNNGNNGIISLTNSCLVDCSAAISFVIPGVGGGPLFYARERSVVRYAPGSATPPTWALPVSGVAHASGDSLIALASFDVTGNYVAKNDGGTIELFKTGTFTPTAVVTTVLVQTSGQCTVLGAVNLTGSTAAATGVVDISGGTFTQTAGPLTVTNSATGSNTVLRVRSGGQATLLGAANTVLNGSAGASGYGISARGGGRVFFVAQPSSCTGATADLTVGTGGGEDQPDTFLSASESALVSANTLSVIARST